MGQGWSDSELRASVGAYLEMRQKYYSGEPFVKTHYYEMLAKTYGRTPKSFEYRMQNISYVLSLMGREWLNGLKPARNVGANVAAKIESLIAELEGIKTANVAAFEITVREKTRELASGRPSGTQKPKSAVSEVTQYYRDPSVKAWCLQQANGKCQCCGADAPFVGTDGLPFLEVHHLRHLADGGSDTVTNAVAVCPNCHRELHYGVNAQSLVEYLYSAISWLTREHPA